MKTNFTKPNIQSLPKKHFQKDGKWIVNPTKTKIVVCACGNKYIKTRAGQGSCLKCLNK